MDPTKVLSAFEMYKKYKNEVQPTQNNQIQKKKKVKRLEKPGIGKRNGIHSQSKNVIRDTKSKDIQKSNYGKPLSNKSTTNKIETKKSETSSIVLNNIEDLTKAVNGKKEKLDELSSRIPITVDEPFSDPVHESEKLFEYVIYPLNRDHFMKTNWEKTPLHIKRNKPKYFRSLMSTPLLDQILRDNYILFTKNLDITSYTNDTRETHNPVGRALPSIVWDYFANGCSVRMLNPQTYIPKLHTLNATLQELFGCFVGSNSYLTPPNSQGFAPHYDDIEAFILQIEGKKRWRLYKPRTDNEVLARFSSANFSQKDLGEPILDTVVNAGDLLYFPRGTIHQGDTFGFDQHSLHITLSVYQKNSWGDFLEKLLPAALKTATEKDVRFRKGLPLDYLKHVGSVHSSTDNSTVRQEFISQTKSLLSNLLKYIDIDQAADEMAKGHIHDFLPPVLSEDENICSIYEGGERMIKDGEIVNRVEIEPDTFVRLTRAHCARLVEEGGIHKLYYSCDNSKEYHEYEPQFVEVDSEFLPVIRQLFVQFPKYIRVEDLSIKDLDKKIQVIRDLWEKGIVISEQPLPILED